MSDGPKDKQTPHERRDKETGEFIQKLVDAVVFFMPDAAWTHDLAVAGFLKMSPLNVRRQMFRRPDGKSVVSRRVGNRDLSTGALIRQWIEEGGESHGANDSLTRPPRPGTPLNQEA